jgi:hypothetical protein
LVAVTVNVYDVPFVRPETVHEVEMLIHTNKPGFEVTVYSVIAASPLAAGAVHETTDSPSASEVPDTDVGASATLDGTAAVDADDARPVPEAFVAVTVNEYEVPLLRPNTVHDVDAVVQKNEPGDDVTV